MPVMSAEAMVAQARAQKNGSVFQPARRDRRLPANPPAAGSSNATTRASMPYFIGAAQPVKPAAKAKVKLSEAARATVKDESSQEDAGPYTEFTIVSTAPDGWSYNVMDFKPANKDKKISMSQFNEPIKLNRKPAVSIIYADPDPKDVKSGPLRPQLGPDGQPVYHNGEMVMVNAEGQTTISAAKGKPSTISSKAKGKAPESSTPNKKKATNKPKTRQVFKASDEVRARRLEEQHPWILEDGIQEWHGTQKDTNDNGIYAILKIDSERGVFEFVPIHRFYDFVPRSQRVASFRAEEAHEKFMSGNKKIDIAAAFAARNGGRVSEATIRTSRKLEQMSQDEEKMFLKREKADDEDLFGDKVEGDIDEMDYEENVADDEEGDRHDEMAVDEEEKRTQDRLKREYISANKAGGAEDDSDEDIDFFDDKLLKKALKKAGEYGELDSDDSDEDDYEKRYGVKKEEEEENEVYAIGVQPQQPTKTASPQPPSIVTPSPKPSTAPRPIAPLPTSSSSGSKISRPSASTNQPIPKPGNTLTPNRGTSPATSAASLLAKRATSPHTFNKSANRAPSPSPSGRAISPLANDGRGRTMSPLVGDSSMRATSPVSAPSPPGNGKKRKDAPSAPPSEATNSSSIKKKKSNAAPGGTVLMSQPSTVPIPTAQDVIDFLKQKGGAATTKDIAIRFRTKESKAVTEVLVRLVKEVGKLDTKGGPVKLKPQFA